MAPPDLLNLAGYRIQEVITNDHDYHINAEVVEPPKVCPHCNSDNLVGFGRREQMVRDLPMHAKRVGLYVDTRRYRCRACTKTFYESLPETDEKRLMTRRLTAWMGRQAIKRTFASIAEEVGCTESTVRVVFSDYVNALEKTVRFETPKWMGIDEIHLIKPRGVIANIQNNTIVELLPNRNKETVVRYLHNLDGKERIQYVAMDMWTPYRDACQAVIPDARIVIDKFHVLKMANEAMEKVRKSLREQLTPKARRGLMHDRFVLLKREADLSDKEALLLSGWVKSYPELAAAYRSKENFFGIYTAESPDEAQAKYIAWKRDLLPEVADAFSDVTRAWENWQHYILGYFDHPITNAYTECLNGLIRVMNRLGRGYSFEALRAKILFSEGAHKHKLSRPKFERKEKPKAVGERQFVGQAGGLDDDMEMGCGVPDGRMFDMFATLQKAPKPPRMPAPPRAMEPPPSTEYGAPEKNYGADISTLVRMIEAGEL
jgi:transposase